MIESKGQEQVRFRVRRDNVEITAMLRRRARRTGRALTWNRNTLLLSYGVLVATIMIALRMRSELVIAPVAVLGLAVIWVFSSLQSKRLEAESFRDEIQAYEDLLAQSTGEPEEFALPPPVVTPVQSPLSNRELEVLNQIATGKSNKQVALDLYISEQTVKNHIKHIFTKLEVNDRTSAILLAMRNGWVDSSPPPDRAAPRAGSGLDQSKAL